MHIYNSEMFRLLVYCLNRFMFPAILNTFWLEILQLSTVICSLMDNKLLSSSLNDRNLVVAAILVIIYITEINKIIIIILF